MAGTGGLSPARVRTSLAWPEFLAAVDSTPPANQLLLDAAAFFHAVQMSQIRPRDKVLSPD